MRPLLALLVVGGLCLAAGCESSRPVAETPPRTTAANSPQPGTQPPAILGSRAAPSDLASEEALPTIALGGAAASGTPAAPTPGQASHASRADVIAALQPVQAILGKWRGTTRREVGDFKGVDDPEWIWDLRTDRNQPALVMKSTQGLYFHSARLTWLSDRSQFQLQTTSPTGQERTFEGGFTESPEEFQESGTTVQRKFKLQFEELGEGKERWQLVMNLQSNDRYLLELSKSRASDFFRFDTVGHQREGTSFAQSDSDYGERKCIISGGLGTIQVSYQGKSYWVCCTGCQAAFQDDPEGWLKEAANKAKK